MIAVSASKLSIADLNNLMRALEIDVVALTEILVPRGHRAEIVGMGHVDHAATHSNIGAATFIGSGPAASRLRIG